MGLGPLSPPESGSFRTVARGDRLLFDHGSVFTREGREFGVGGGEHGRREDGHDSTTSLCNHESDGHTRDGPEPEDRVDDDPNEYHSDTQ